MWCVIMSADREEIGNEKGQFRSPVRHKSECKISQEDFLAKCSDRTRCLHPLEDKTCHQSHPSTSKGKSKSLKKKKANYEMK